LPAAASITARARILHVPQPEFHRVHVRRNREFVDERLKREDIGVGAQRAQRGRA